MRTLSLVSLAPSIAFLLCVVPACSSSAPELPPGDSNTQDASMSMPTGDDAGATTTHPTDASVPRDANVQTMTDAASVVTPTDGGFGQDPIVFVHGYQGSAANWSTAIPYFMSKGYPANYLRAISYSDSTGGNVPNAMELQAFVDQVISDLHVDKVDMVVHSMGAISSRYYIKFLGGNTRVRDFVSLAGVNHGNLEAIVGSDQASKEMYPAYPTDLTTVVGKINGLTGGGGDDTPFGVEDSGGLIYYSALWSNFDLVVSPGESECLFLTKATSTESDCSTTHNTEYKNLGHNNFTTDTTVLANVLQLVQLHNARTP